MKIKLVKEDDEMEFTVAPNITVFELKKIASSYMQLPLSTLILSFNGILLIEECISLRVYGVNEKDNIIYVTTSVIADFNLDRVGKNLSHLLQNTQFKKKKARLTFIAAF